MSTHFNRVTLSRQQKLCELELERLVDIHQRAIDDHRCAVLFEYLPVFYQSFALDGITDAVSKKIRRYVLANTVLSTAWVVKTDNTFLRYS